MSSIAIYVHFPWCASICPYCDFDKQATDFRLVDAYIDALLLHIEGTPARGAHSLFFGGGTPSLMTAERLGRIIRACQDRFGEQSPLGGGTGAPPPPVEGKGESMLREVTVEANPSDVVAHKVEAYLTAGVTRMSLGVQSLEDAELRFLGRRHSAEKAVRAVRAIREAGCRDLSLDLMYGLPTSTVASVTGSLQQMIELAPDHISCYALTLEPETPMGHQAETGEISVLGDDAVADQYATIQATLAAAGFEQYELSNWARPGHQSAHNLTYWRNGEWVGLGAGASGSFAGIRYKRTPVIREYIAAAAAAEPGYCYEEAWSRESQMHDTVMLGLRLSEGVSDSAFVAQFDVPLREYLHGLLSDLVRAGVLLWKGDRLALDPSSYFVCNSVLAEILPTLNERE